MKKLTIVLLIFILLAASIPAFGTSEPIIVEPIQAIPIMPIFINTRVVNTTPLYRLYNNDWAVHTYTTSTSERADLLADGWIDKGIVAYVSPIKLPGYVLLHRYEGFGRLTKLSTTLSSGISWWGHTGTVGYVPTEPIYKTPQVHESVRALSEGDMPWDSDYYYSNQYFELVPWGLFPVSLPGYNLTDKRFNMWSASKKVQEITVKDMPTKVTGGHKYYISWTTFVAGGKVKLMYSKDNGATWITIQEELNHPTINGMYQWTVPNITNSEMKVRVLWMPTSGESATVWDTTSAFASTRDPLTSIIVPIGPEIEITSIKPTVPTNLTAKPGIRSKKITLYWTDNSANETAFSVERRTPRGFFAEIATVGLNETEYTDTAIVTDVLYTYRIKAKGVIIDSSYSNEADARYTGLVVKPALPEGFIFPEYPDPPENAAAAFTDGSESEVLVSWDPPAGDYTGFHVERDTGSGWTSLGNTMEDDHDFVDVNLTGLSGDISYRVKTYDEALTSAPSNVAIITVDDGGTPDPDPDPESPDIFDGTQSGWAEAELIEAYENGLTYPGVMYEYGRAITREEFCVIAVKLYEKLTGVVATPGVDPFDDTDNPDILKAYKLGIVKGVSATQFAPANNITRQEMCVMIYRALDAAEFDTSVDPTAAFPFTDFNDIALWALNEVKFCHQNGIMNGTSPTTIDPLLNTPREQAIVLIGRTYNSFAP